MSKCLSFGYWYLKPRCMTLCLNSLVLQILVFLTKCPGLLLCVVVGLVTSQFLTQTICQSAANIKEKL